MGEAVLLGGRVALSLAVVLALLWFLAQRLGGRADTGRRVPITVLGRHSLGRRTGLAVVEVAGQVLLLGVSDTGIRLISEVTGNVAANETPGVLPADDEPDRPHDDDTGADDSARAGTRARPDFSAVLAARTANAWQRPGTALEPARPGAAALLDKATWARAWNACLGASTGVR